MILTFSAPQSFIAFSYIFARSDTLIIDRWAISVCSCTNLGHSSKFIKMNMKSISQQIWCSWMFPIVFNLKEINNCILRFRILQAQVDFKKRVFFKYKNQVKESSKAEWNAEGKITSEVLQIYWTTFWTPPPTD